MSERPREHAPPDSYITGRSEPPPQRIHSTPVSQEHQQYGPPSSAHPPSATSSPALHRRPAGNGRTMELPPLPQAPSASGGSFSPASRSVGVMSILNPTEPDDALQGRRRKASQLDSPSSSMSILPPLATSNPPPYSASGTPTPSSSTQIAGSVGSIGERPPRRILTPRSPSLHRAASLNQLNAPSATYSAQNAPFAVSPRSRTYTIEPGASGAPPLPTPPAAMRQSYSFSAPTPPVQQSGRRASTGPPPRAMRPTSESTSPRSSYSSYSQAGQGSPAAYAGPSSMPTLSSAYSAGQDAAGGSGTASAPGSVGPDRQRAMGVPISSSGGQNVYRMMTLETTSGTVQLPVDVQAASRVADEKRRRNAGASARFRQRRKEKEKEASTTISRLEQQVKELSEDMDFYKRERDYFAGVVLQTPGGDRHFPRPQSPRHRRRSSLVGMGGSSNAGYVPIQEQGRSPDDGRNLRRRTSTLSLPPPQGQGQLHGPSGYQGNYGPQTYGQPLAPQPPPPPMHQGAPPLPSPLSRGHLPGPIPPAPPQLMQAPPQTGPWNPYAERKPPGGPSQGRDGR